MKKATNTLTTSHTLPTFLHTEPLAHFHHKLSEPSLLSSDRTIPIQPAAKVSMNSQETEKRAHNDVLLDHIVFQNMIEAEVEERQLRKSPVSIGNDKLDTIFAFNQFYRDVVDGRNVKNKAQVFAQTKRFSEQILSIDMKEYLKQKIKGDV